MGRESVNFTVGASLERHNCDGDEADNEAWERLRQKVQNLIDADHDYERITEMVVG
jgi:hypothetical protein